MIEFLIKRSAAHAATATGTTATLSRGYGRQTTGFRLAGETDTAATIGDEPRQLYCKYSSSIRVYVGERRAEALRSIMALHPETEQVLLDDAYQHRAVRAHLTILLMDYHRPFYADYPFPAGRLRERRHGARRADVLVVTKCPHDLFATEQQRMSAKIRPYTRPGVPIFFAGIQYDQPVSFATRQPGPLSHPVVLVSGLANADPLDQYVRQTYRLIHHARFPDHHAYSRAELDTLLTSLPPQTALLTTEKDWVKLDALLTDHERATLPLYYLPVAVQFLPGQEVGFDRYLTQARLKNP